ncbi:hypothetical protein [Nonomuraea jiangxiensis]|uniref:Uncharacterized protein n=1 Tax=Nonomuraea jiangxiensis TaxID=633440 RepID=A0A1G9TPH6_9ACTN|nr:hypothetical protein [Nonomuraea jiangxiensis]SDM49334.1 hypothetical protein SAMN05421869_14546 [Nonomuraea jiangxiensis]
MIIKILAGMAIGLTALSGTAAADPIVGAPDLTGNSLYKAGKLPKTSCPAKKGTSRSSTEKYLRILVGCLDKAWRGDKVKLQITYQANGSKKYKSWPFITRDGIYVGLADDWVKAGNDQRVFHEMASVYGEVIQSRTGIAQAAHTLNYGGDEKVLKQQERRYAYQKDCLAGAAARALGRPAKNSSLKGNERYWFEQGYKAGGPKACNTWKASDAKVA